MKTNKITGPELLVDDHHGIYVGQIAYESLLPYYRDQIKRQLSEDDIKSIETGPDDEFYIEACDNMSNVTLRTVTGQKLSMQYAEGGIWIIPYCYMRTKEYQENWNM